MNSKIRFTPPKQNAVINVILNISRPALDLKLNKAAFSMSKEFSNFRLGMIEKDRTMEDVEKFLISICAGKISKLKILGLIICEIESQQLEKLAEHERIKFIDFNDLA